MATEHGRTRTEGDEKRGRRTNGKTNAETRSHCSSASMQKRWDDQTAETMVFNGDEPCHRFCVS